ncbi:hypothetical protein AAVH_02114 [Aphelenchoides avenae]|nr:hypothetical protein AAVH_02114 [Aphelenchus avenae]
MQCYTLRSERNADVIKKGCTVDCSTVKRYDTMCELCDGDQCNNVASLLPMSGFDECAAVESSGNRLGTGTGFGQRSNGIGSGTLTGGSIGDGTANKAAGTRLGSGAASDSLHGAGGIGSGAAGAGYAGGIGSGAAGSSYSGGIGSGTAGGGYGASPVIGVGRGVDVGGERVGAIGGGTAARLVQDRQAAVGHGAYSSGGGSGYWYASSATSAVASATLIVLSVTMLYTNF